MKHWEITDTGLIRHENQDAFGFAQLPGGYALAVVCDGMGGVAGGSIASTVAVETFIRTLTETGHSGHMDRAVQEAVTAANAAIRQRAAGHPELKSMGTTLVSALVKGDKVLISNVGDSRAYLAGADGLRQISRDHSLVEDMVQRGELTREQARNHPHKNLITRALAAELEQSYGRGVLAVSCLDLDAAALNTILQKVLYEFPVRELDFALPRWVTMLDKGHWLQTEVYSAAMAFSEQVTRMKDLSASGGAALACDAVQQTALSGMNLSDGIVRVTVILKPEIFYQVLSEQTGLEIGDEAGLMPCILSLAKASREYEKIRSALEQVEATGYGIVMPTIDELSLEQPEIVQQGGRYGVRLEASAPSIQMMKATIHTEISPIVGTEKQSEDLVQSLLQDFESDPVKLWESNIFGKSLHELVNDGLQNKLLHMPQEARTKMQETLEQVINEGCTGLICILL